MLRIQNLPNGKTLIITKYVSMDAGAFGQTPSSLKLEFQVAVSHRHGHWDPNSAPWQGQRVIPTAESSFQSSNLIILTDVSLGSNFSRNVSWSSVNKTQCLPFGRPPNLAFN